MNGEQSKGVAAVEELADEAVQTTAVSPPLLAARDLYKSYARHRLAVPVLKGASLEIKSGEFLCLVGASGSGKSTLLHLLGTLDQPDAGVIIFDGRRIDNLPGRQRDQLRNQEFGFIFQFYHLLPELNLLENVLMPHMIQSSVWSWWYQRRRLRRQALELLERVGLADRVKHRPRELSGGEMQRAAIARALVNRPRILLADEPTGNLDAAAGEEITRLLRTLNREEGLTIMMVTHNWEIARGSDRVVRMAGGRVEAMEPAGSRKDGAANEGVHQRQAV
jgi:lipoprotein-releasing system ATP-binding protein